MGDMGDQSESARSRRGAEKAHSSYDESVVADVEYGNGSVIQCQYCPGRVFRRSRLRSRDLQDLLFMRYPVRCLRCGQRQMVSFTIAGVSVPSHIKQRRHRRSADKFANWPPAGTADGGTPKDADEETDAPPGEL